MPVEKVSGVSLTDSERTEEGILYKYSVRAAGATPDARQRRAERKAERDARMKTVALPNQIDEVNVVVGTATTSDPAFTVFRINVHVKKAF